MQGLVAAFVAVNGSDYPPSLYSLVPSTAPACDCAGTDSARVEAHFHCSLSSVFPK